MTARKATTCRDCGGPCKVGSGRCLACARALAPGGAATEIIRRPPPQTRCACGLRLAVGGRCPKCAPDRVRAHAVDRAAAAVWGAPLPPEPGLPVGQDRYSVAARLVAGWAAGEDL